MEAHEDIVKALALAEAGDWDGAHGIVQRHDSDPTACWLHALIHKTQGEDGNARYWYARTSQSYDLFSDPVAELAAMREALVKCIDP